MKFSTLVTIAAALVAADAFSPETFKAPTVDDAAAIARTLINKESLANVNTIYQEGEDQGLPASFVEYYADCGDGNPVLLAIDMATSFKNLNKGSPATLSVKVGDHALDEIVNPHYPGSRPHSIAGSPRINLRGKFVEVSEEEAPELEKCFLKKHKDAAWWLPGNPIHSSHWVKFEVDGAYFLGGFGDTGYIGKIPSDLYSNAPLLDEKPHEPKTKHHKKPKDEKFKSKHHKGTENHSFVERITFFEKQTIEKIQNQITILKNALNSETIPDDAVLTLEDFNHSIKDFIKSQFNKRDVEEVNEVNLKSLTKENISLMIDNLEELSTKISEYSSSLIQKLEAEKPEKAYPKSDHPWDLRRKLDAGEITQEEFQAAKAEIYKNKKAHKGDVFANGNRSKSDHPWDLRDKLDRGEITQEEFQAAKAEIYKNKKAHHNSEKLHDKFRVKELRAKAHKGGKSAPHKEESVFQSVLDYFFKPSRQ
ncbi:CYFA0S13e01816g1_1 [Cyberlindnera fabianii]|uniref:CYFA0S13e01816g1_1 n=1 Tax=Cyberlindnera fabianii TaxID=36022 RepID=A0A061B2M0_CYBFA|nr:CYFA0S13e01816g1_1 [Cyberlindnera fabianii]